MNAPHGTTSVGGAFDPAGGPLTPADAMLGWMELAPYGIFTTDAEFNLRSWNRWLEVNSGLMEPDVVGRPLFELFPDLKERRLDEHFHRALAGQVAVLSTALHRYLIPMPPPSRDYGVTHMLQTARVAPLHPGMAAGTLTVIEDVTQRECQASTLRRQQEHDRLLSAALALLLESENPLRVAADLFPRIAAPLKLEAYFNFLIAPGTREMRLHAAGGISPEVRRALGVASVDGSGPCSHCACFQKILVLSHVQSSTEPHTELIRKIGLRAYVGFPLLIGDRLLGTLSFGSYGRDVIAPDEVNLLTTVSQYVAVAIDRTQRESALRHARENLARHASELETKVAERTAKLNETIQQLESFSYTIAHDLRAPIRSLRGYTDVLLSDYGEQLPSDAHSILHRLQRASTRLDALTRDLLKFSKIARADVQLAAVDLDELLEDIVQVTPALQSGMLRVRAPLGSVWGQRTLLQQCVSNLFDNALKFARPGEPARITVCSEVLSGEAPAGGGQSGNPFNSATATPRPFLPGPRVRLWIEDNGIGIPSGAHEKIFGIFERVSGLETIEGTGIGLAIVARAMQQMGGRCGVESTLGEGSRFWLELATPTADPGL